MQPYVIDANNGSSVEDFQIRENLITTLKNRFTTYGYKQVRTSTFEYYDLYSTISGTVNKDEMIKVIDSGGKVLVLRPDVTIPITRMIALNKQHLSDNLRLFYMLDVFRQSVEQADEKESTQAGIEYFGENKPEVDSEVIMLAIHTLKDLDFSNFKIEMGHAGFFKELISQTTLSQAEIDQLQILIQSKNIVEMEPFLTSLSINEDVKKAIQMIPLLYGDPAHVIQQAKDIILNDEMEVLLQNLIEVYEVIKDYGVEDSIVFNFGLINNMNYYSGIIFQGFVANVGKPVLMGGRYDNLGEQYGTGMPAIGFAFEVDLLLHALNQQGLSDDQNPSVDMIIYYEKLKQREALSTAFRLREAGYQVLTSLSDTNNTASPTYIVSYEENQNQFLLNGKKTEFSSYADLYELLRDEKGEVT
ncbi:ATP phosphoribosyltransferase regulatory subunit [Virgibacillus profundi]|uniref:ATP phosphoribosyltransferase regulatory subunit n=1 Tax=Virgibacillus profundi TaxID=2024555 RepID=A0A2A2IGC3_9BACI|nr:ATP phosphoribosyltransferase regulatory subunit [Virgibacillus profundi]PAV30592.1 ATP phosphoribosyltransferase regulatory subunit [Virgibacillus profundi]PXY54764.1 ATP phosphoribosyltransferase regulatory subunit [Virgibacillus profundi]